MFGISHASQILPPGPPDQPARPSPTLRTSHPLLDVRDHGASRGDFSGLCVYSRDREPVPAARERAGSDRGRYSAGSAIKLDRWHNQPHPNSWP
jgi:hypothetical protein